MKLRVYRTWHWELNCSPLEVRYGGENPMKLVSSDTLQYLDEDDVWKDVEVVEEEKPLHPRAEKEKRNYEKMQKEWEEMFKKLKPELGKLPDLAELIRKS
jgi:hypothetical protein